MTSCSRKVRRHRIGVSQCSQDIWRDKQNAELRTAAYFHDHVELCFASAYDSDERQVQQIDSLVKTGIDLLIVAPNQVATISPAIDRAYDSGIPVIVFERKTNSRKYTAYIGADNYEMGHVMGEYIASRLHGKGKVMEVMGLKGSSPAIERHKGFSDVMAKYPNIEVVATLQGDWTEENAYSATKQWISGQQHTAINQCSIDYVFAQNDRMAMGARRAFQEVANDSSLGKGEGLSIPLFCGIDGLPGEDGGIRLVRDSILDATYIYPTHGDRLLQQAVDILDGKTYNKEVRLMAAMVTHENANALLMENEEITRQADYLDQLHKRADSYLDKLGTQRAFNIMSVFLIIMSLALMVILYRYHLQKLRVEEERGKMEREQLNFYTQVSHELRTPLTLIEGPLSQLAVTRDMQQAGAEASGLFAIIQRNTHQLTLLINKMLNMQTTGSIDNLSSVPETVATVDVTKLDSAQKEPSDDNATVLIVDDNADIRAYLRTILHNRFQVNEAPDGQQGLALANEIVPDLIVSDVMMPVMNGLEFCQRVKGGMATSHIPVILLTARALSKHQIEGYESGADAYITKPFQAEVLLARIDNLLRSRHQLKNLFGGRSQQQDNLQTPGSSSTDSPKIDSFLLKFRDYVEKHLSDSELSVETVGSDLGLSRVQLYRKVKALTGQSPVELLRKARLEKGRHLLKTTDMTISEVAYEVGFSAPSYFTKCFKDEYGHSPSDL